MIRSFKAKGSVMKDLTEEQLKTRQGVIKKLVAERWMKEMSQEELARLVDTSRSNISRIESGRQNVTIDQLIRMADAMGSTLGIVMEENPPYGETTEYSVRLFDDELFTFRFSDGPQRVPVLGSVNTGLSRLFPAGLELSDEGLLRWLEARSIPKNREFVGAILSTLGLEINDIKGITDVCRGLSLTDSYWIVPKGSGLKFADFNLFENDFSPVLSLVAFTGYGRSRTKLTTSPELTTNGMLRKGWRYFGKNDIWLYKGGTQDAANAGNEPYSEVYACQAAERMGLNAVHYELARWKGILASRCRLFTDINTSFVPIGQLVRSGGITACIDYYKSLGDDYYQQLASMLVFDAVILNEDRHFGNFGLLRDNRSGRIIAPAPVFDNGNGLLCYAMRSDFDGDLDSYIAQRKNPYGPGFGFDELCSMVIGPKQRAQLRRLINFRFAPNDVSDLPAWRLEALNELIQKRVRRLLEL